MPEDKTSYQLTTQGNKSELTKPELPERLDSASKNLTIGDGIGKAEPFKLPNLPTEIMLMIMENYFESPPSDTTASVPALIQAL